MPQLRLTTVSDLETATHRDFSFSETMLHLSAEHSSDPSLPKAATVPGGNRRAVNIAVALAAVLFVGVLLELAVRCYAAAIGRGFWENPHEFISPFFTGDGSPAPYLDGGVFVFKEGEWVSAEKAPGEIRIVCLGGSTTLPGRDAEAVSYARELERRLSERFPGVTIRVLNAGENAYSSAHSLVNLALRVLDVDPDVVTVYHNVNDLSANYFGDGVVSDYANKYMTSYYLGYRHRIGVLAELARMSRLVRIVDNRLQTWHFAARRFDTTHDYRPGLRYFARNLRTIVAIARANGVDVVLGTEAGRTAMRTSEGFAAYNAETRHVAAESRVPLAEIADVVVDDDLFVDDVHNTSQGVRQVAAAWFEPVAQAVERRIARRRTTQSSQ